MAHASIENSEYVLDQSGAYHDDTISLVDRAIQAEKNEYLLAKRSISKREHSSFTNEFIKKYINCGRKIIDVGKYVTRVIVEATKKEIEYYAKLAEVSELSLYVDVENSIIRKGAISAQLNETVLIPINMRDGCILGRGLGNEDYNYSAPHGAGRLMSRKAAKEQLSVEDFQNEMKDVYTTTANAATLDEAPMAYKPIESILDNIKDTVEIIDILTPLYNFKAEEE